MGTPFEAEAGVYARIAIGAAGSPTTYAFLANVVGDIAAGGSTKMADITPHGVSNWTKNFPTLNTWGPVTFDIAFVASSTGDGAAGFTSGLGAVWSSNVLREYEITWPDGTAAYFSAYVSKFDLKAPVNDIIKATVTLEGYGEPILA